MSARRLSVALPVRNGENYLAAALDSILAQSHADFDLFVSDNASDNATPAILAEYARRDARIKVSRSAEPLGQVANMNRAVALADTPWVKLFCHDDLMRPDCMAQIHAAIEQVDGGPVALIGNGERHLFGNGAMSDAQGDGSLECHVGHEVLRRRFAGGDAALPIPSVTTATVRKDAFDARGGFDPRWVHFDVFCWYEMLLDWDFAALPAQLTVNRIHGAQVALAARASLRSASDHRAFIGEFVRRHGAGIGLGWMEKLRARFIAPGHAASALVSELRGGRPGAALAQLPRLPLAWLPLMPLLVLRCWHREKTRQSALGARVPVELFYPR